MPLSFYCLAFPLEDSAGDVLLFSTRTAAKAVVSRNTLKRLQQGLPAAETDKPLWKLGLLVPDPDTEKRSVMQLLDHRTFQSGAWLRFMVVLNLDCNFGCVYCYEDPHKGPLYMSDGTAGEVVRFIRQCFRESTANLIVDFYGGEPLMSLSLLKSMAAELKAFTDRRQAAFEFSLITNGSLFTRKVAAELVPLGLKKVKFTLDGPRHIHDSLRPFKNGRGSFGVLIQNLKSTWDLVTLGLGGNYTRDNYREFPKLLTCLASENLGPARIRTIRFSPVLSTSAARVRMGMTAGCAFSGEAWLAEADLFLREALIKHGYPIARVAPVICMIERENSLVIHYNGDLYKCPGFCGRSEFRVGDVRAGLTVRPDVYRHRPWQNSECGDCAYLPLCFGGCRFMSYLAGDAGRVDCRKAYWEETLAGMVMQELRPGPS